MEALAHTVTIRLPDGSTKVVPKGTTVRQVAEAIGPRLARDAWAGKLDGKVVDLVLPIEADGSLEIITAKSPDAVPIYRHSTAHLTAQAVKRLFPDVQIGIGPPIENGYYYDFNPARPFTPEDLAAIEAEMRKIIGEDLPIVREEMPIERGDRDLREPEGRAEGRDREGHPGGGARHVLPPGRVRGPLPRPARGVDRAARRLQADAHGGRLLEGRREEPDAPADLRSVVPLAEGARRRT